MIESTLPPLRIKGRSLLPIVQGGMGVGVSAHRLAGNVARLGAVGTIAAIDLRHLHPDLIEATGRSRDKDAINAANLVALDREIRAARAIADGHGLVAVNVMRAVSQYADYVRQACASGADAIVMGAGLALDLPDLTAEYPDVALIPILSDVRGITLTLKKWMKKGRLPDAIVIEHPRHAGGHLGAAKVEDLADDDAADLHIGAHRKLQADVGGLEGDLVVVDELLGEGRVGQVDGQDDQPEEDPPEHLGTADQAHRLTPPAARSSWCPRWPSTAAGRSR